MKYHVIDLAKYIITIANESNYYLSENKLQFLLYLLQVKYIRKFKETLFDEDIYLKRGRFYIEKVNDMFCGFGGNNILLSYPETKDIIELHVQDIIKDILDKFGQEMLYTNKLIFSSDIYNRFSDILEKDKKILISPKDMELCEHIEI